MGFLGDRAQKDRASVLFSVILDQLEGVCLNVWAARQERGPDKQSSFTGLCRQLPHRVSRGPGEKGRGATREACLGAFSQQRCSWRLPSPTSQRAGEAFFQSRAFALLGRLLKAAGSPAPGGHRKRRFLFPLLNGDILREPWRGQYEPEDT